MKFFRLPLMTLTLAATLFSCSKEGDDNDPDCMNNHTTKVKFSNSGSVALRVEVASQLTPQYEAVNPVVAVDIAPGASTTREFESGRYMIIWKSGCPSNCNVATAASSRDYADCESYEEERGL